MGTYAVFLRGINVSGISIKMADLRQALEGCGFAGAKTVLATGNAILTSEKDARSVKAGCEKCLRSAFGYDAWVVVLAASRVAKLVAACPYPADDKATHTYITLSSDHAVLDQLEAGGKELEGAGVKRLGPEALAWLAPAGGTLDSPFSKLSAKPKYKAATTTRNLRTLIKVRDATGT